MEFKKIGITDTYTLNATYTNYDGDTITLSGCNAVHPDLLNAFRALVPHLSLLTEQREAFGKTLSALEENKENKGEDNVYRRIGVTSVTIGKEDVILFGQRVTDSGEVIKLVSPKVNLEGSLYEYRHALDLAIAGLEYEAKLYITEKKWKYIQTTLEFAEEKKTDADEYPFDNVQPDEVPRVSVEFSPDVPLKEDKSKKRRKLKVVKMN
jgi:hypothetical protein|uniref:Uncharacterized protein n=1 Tax=Siphoviridae sp. cttU829 TaxID=2823605 RepID=A0A8S5LC52_9CAUD|nr:MAG TPA: hypothetical protein [Siphoviridae sp. cttU829]